MKPRFILEEAIQALKASALRSSLTIIGIIVGIFSVTAMLALGEGLSNNILERFRSFSSGDITVSGELSHNDLAWIQEQPYVKGAVASQNISNITAIAGGTDFAPTVQTAVGDYETVVGLELVSGEGFDFTDPNYAERVAIVDEGFVTAVTEEVGIDISSGTISVNGQQFTVIGVSEGGTGGFGRRGDGTIIVPYRSAIGALTNTSQFSSIGVSLEDQQYYEIAGQHILEALNTSRSAAKDSGDYFSVQSAQEIIESAQETTAMLSLFLGIVGGIALFVGGIGTMNMMLTTVTERTKEIGLRKAIGARDNDILAQILAESIFLTSLGGAIGIFLTYLGSLAANAVLTEESVISVQVSGEVVLYATLVSLLVGVVFGLYPARNAAKMQPVDALRAA